MIYIRRTINGYETEIYGERMTFNTYEEMMEYLEEKLNEDYLRTGDKVHS